MPDPTVVVTCPHCRHPYPITDRQREVYRGGNTGRMNCGRPFKVHAAPQRAVDAAPGMPARQGPPSEAAGAPAEQGAPDPAPADAAPYADASGPADLGYSSPAAEAARAAAAARQPAPR